MKSKNGIPIEWARVRIDVVTHDDERTWTATTPTFPNLQGAGKHRDLAAASLLRQIADAVVDVSFVMPKRRKA